MTSLTTGLEEHTNYEGMNLYGFSMADQSCLTVMNIDFYSGGQDRFLINQSYIREIQSFNVDEYYWKTQVCQKNDYRENHKSLRWTQ